MPTKAKKEGNARHVAKLDQIKIQPYKEEGAAIRAAAVAAGQSVQGYVLQSIRERMQREAAVQSSGGSPETTGVPTVAADGGTGTGAGSGISAADTADNVCSRSISYTASDFSIDQWVEWSHKGKDEPVSDWKERINQSLNKINRNLGFMYHKCLWAMSNEERDLLYFHEAPKPKEPEQPEKPKVSEMLDEYNMELPF